MGFFKKMTSLVTTTIDPPAQHAPTTVIKSESQQSGPVVQDPRCPYCGHEFQPPPKRSKKCPACAKTSYVVRRSGRASLVTQEQYDQEAARREAIYADDKDDEDVLEDIRTKIVGVTHDNDNRSSRQEIIASCKVGEELKLKHTPIKQDRNAVGVYRKNGEQLGWLSREVAADLVEHLHDEDEQVSCKIIDLTGGAKDKPTRGCNIRIKVTLRE